MSKWTFEPGHTEVRFRARHMMVTYVEGLFKDVHGRMELDRQDPERASCEVVIETKKLWTGEEQRDAHLFSADFFDAEQHPKITFRSTGVKQRSETELSVTGDLTIRGVTKPVCMAVTVVGSWDTPYWESKGDDWKNFGPIRRVGFTGTLTVNRHDWGVSWQDHMDEVGVVVSDEIELRIDAEALSDEDVTRAEQEAKAWKAA